MFHQRRFRHCRVFAAAAALAAAALVCVAVPTAAAWAQGNEKDAGKTSQAATVSTPTSNHPLTSLLGKNVGKKDAALFGGLLEMLGDGKTPLHVVADTTAAIKQKDFDGTVTGKTALQGNFAGAFASDNELTVKQGDLTVTTKTRFVCDGKTLWTIKPGEKQYTEQPLASAKSSLSDALMSASFDIASLLGAEAANGFKNADPEHKLADAAFKVEESTFQGVSCRVLSIISNEKDKSDSKGTFRVYVGADKRLRGIEMKLVGKTDGSVITITETFRTMEPMPTTTEKALFTFTPPEGFQKVDKFAD